MIREIFSEGLGTDESPFTLSLMRIGTFLSILIAGAIGIIGILKGCNLKELSSLCFVFIGSGIGGKVFQKRSEVKVEVEELKRIK